MVSLGYYFPNATELELSKSHINGILRASFADSSRSVFYSCNTGTALGDSFAQKWANTTGGQTWAYYGKTYYGDMNVGTTLELRIARKLGGFYIGGSWNLPKAGRIAVNGINSYIRKFMPN